MEDTIGKILAVVKREHELQLARYKVAVRAMVDEALRDCAEAGDKGELVAVGLIANSLNLGIMDAETAGSLAKHAYWVDVLESIDEAHKEAFCLAVRQLHQVDDPHCDCPLCLGDDDTYCQ